MKCNTVFCLCFLFSPLLVFLKDQASSHLIETIIQLSHKSLLRNLYKNHLKGQLVNLALHPIANFPVQRLTAASAKYKMVGRNVKRNFQVFFIERMTPFFSPFLFIVPDAVR